MNIDGTAYVLALLTSALLSSAVTWVGLSIKYDEKLEVISRDMDLYCKKGGVDPSPRSMSETPTFNEGLSPKVIPNRPAREKGSSEDFGPPIAAATDASARVLEMYNLLEKRMAAVETKADRGRSLELSPFTMDDGWWVADDVMFLFPKGVVIGNKMEAKDCTYGTSVLSVDADGNNCPEGAGSVTFGYANSAKQNYSTVTGGSQNKAEGLYSSIVGGLKNSAIGENSAVHGGRENEADGIYGSVTGGRFNKAMGEYTTVLGGYDNVATGHSSTASGGILNKAEGEDSSVMGGIRNKANGRYATIGGGQSNSADGTSSSISGGKKNTAKAKFTSISGGSGNQATKQYESILG